MAEGWGIMSISRGAILLLAVVSAVAAFVGCSCTLKLAPTEAELQEVSRSRIPHDPARDIPEVALVVGSGPCDVTTAKGMSVVGGADEGQGQVPFPLRAQGTPSRLIGDAMLSAPDNGVARFVRPTTPSPVAVEMVATSFFLHFEKGMWGPVTTEGQVAMKVSVMSAKAHQRSVVFSRVYKSDIPAGIQLPSLSSPPLGILDDFRSASSALIRKAMVDAIRQLLSDPEFTDALRTARQAAPMQQ